MPDADHSLATEGCKTMLSEGRTALECRARRNDASVFYQQMLLVKTIDEHGERDSYYCFMNDITTRREAEEQLAK